MKLTFFFCLFFVFLFACFFFLPWTKSENIESWSCFHKLCVVQGGFYVTVCVLSQTDYSSIFICLELKPPTGSQRHQGQCEFSKKNEERKARQVEHPGRRKECEES